MATKVGSYRDLEIWKLSMTIARETFELTSLLPDVEKFGLRSQMQRASVSIPSNIAEGWGRGVGQAQVSFLRIARGSLCELETLFLLSGDFGYVDSSRIRPLLERLDQLSRQISAYSSVLRSKIVRESEAPYNAGSSSLENELAPTTRNP